MDWGFTGDHWDWWKYVAFCNITFIVNNSKVVQQSYKQTFSPKWFLREI